MNRKIVSIMIIIVILVLVGSIYMINSTKINKSENYESMEFKVYFFNAGKADCMLISNNDKYIMIDTGESTLSNEILTYLKNNNIEKLDYLIITHFDKDHVGSASSIIDNIQVDNVLQSNCPKESEYYTNYLNSLSSKNITPQTVTGNLNFTLGDMNIVVNGPDKVYDNNESNNSSLIVSINYGETNYLFTGDSQNDRIKDYLSQNSNQKYDFIKIPYHGHYQKKLDNLLETVTPKYAVITSSLAEPEDSETIEILNSLNTKYYLTRSGSITLFSDGKTVNIIQ